MKISNRIWVIVTGFVIVSGIFSVAILHGTGGSRYTEPMIFERQTAEFARYKLRFPRVINLHDHAQARINTSIEDEVKRLLHGNYDATKSDVYKRLRRQSVKEVADSFLGGVSRKDPPRFFDSLSVTDSFLTKKILCLRVFNSRNDGGAKDVEFVSFLTFDLKSGRQIPYQEFIHSERQLLKIAKPYFEKATQQLITDKEMTLGSEVGLDQDGLVIEYNDIVDKVQAELRIPWQVLRKNMVLREEVLF